MPLADIGEFIGGGDRGEFSARLGRVDRDLTARIRRLRVTQRRLRQLAAGDLQFLPADVTAHI